MLFDQDYHNRLNHIVIKSFSHEGNKLTLAINKLASCLQPLSTRGAHTWIQTQMYEHKNLGNLIAKCNAAAMKNKCL